MTAPTWNLDTLFPGGLDGEAFNQTLSRADQERLFAPLSSFSQRAVPHKHWTERFHDAWDANMATSWGSRASVRLLEVCHGTQRTASRGQLHCSCSQSLT